MGPREVSFLAGIVLLFFCDVVLLGVGSACVDLFCTFGVSLHMLGVWCGVCLILAFILVVHCFFFCFISLAARFFIGSVRCFFSKGFPGPWDEVFLLRPLTVRGLSGLFSTFQTRR